MKIERKSNIELLRIILMLFIVLYHAILHGNVLENVQNEGLKTVFLIIEFMIIIHVNLFVVITGYFQSTGKFNQSKLWSLINASLFYKIIIMFLFMFFGELSFSKIEILKEIFPLNINEYWFLQTFFYLYCLSPFINSMLNSFDKKTYKKYLMISIIIFSIIPYMTGNQAFNNTGYTLYNFILLYSIGAYLRKYPLKENIVFKHISIQSYQIICLMIYVLCGMLNFLLYNTANLLLGINSIFDEISKNILTMNFLYSNPIIIIQTICFFSLFQTFNFQNKLINWSAKLTLGVYLIHDNNLVRNELYHFVGVDKGPIQSYTFLGYVLLITIVIYICCIIIEELRQILFKFIYNRKISEKIRTKYYQWLSGFKSEN